MSTPFAAEVRVLLCEHCGAPLEVPLEGGVTRCRFCGAEAIIASRAVAAIAVSPGAAPPSASDEHARLQRLRLQEAAAQVSPYDLRHPPAGLEWIAQTYPTPAALATAAPALEGTLREEMKRAAANRSSEAEGRVFYVLSILENAMSLGGSDPVRLRASLESARDSFTDAGFRQLATCRLVGQARHAGDLTAAAGWLRQCDAASTQLPLDTAYRIALAGVQLGGRDFRAALGTLGARAFEVPLSLSWKPAAQMFRVHALEQLGQQAEADKEYAEATGWKGAATWLPGLIAANRDLGDLCAQTIARWQAAHPEGAEAAERAGVAASLRLQRRARLRRWALLLVVLTVIVWRVLACTGALDAS